MQKRNPCGTLLLKTVELKSGKELLYPFKLYSYKSVKDSLQCLLLRSGFYENCQLWRNSTNHSDIKDIYDACIWKDFQDYLGSPFLSLHHSFAFVLNVDWFQPYTHTTSSVGVIYLTVLNLPRTLRYKRDSCRANSRTSRAQTYYKFVPISFSRGNAQILGWLKIIC